MRGILAALAGLMILAGTPYAAEPMPELGGNINNVTHDRAFVPRDAKSVQVLVEVEVADAATGPRILARLRELDMPAEDVRGVEGEG